MAKENTEFPEQEEEIVTDKGETISYEAIQNDMLMESWSKYEWLLEECFRLRKELERVRKSPVVQPPANTAELDNLKKEKERVEMELEQRKRTIKSLTEYDDETYGKLENEPSKYGFHLRPNDALVLRLLQDNGSSRFTDLVDTLKRNPKTINDCLKVLMPLGFVVKSEADKMYAATDKGREALDNFLAKI